MKYHFIPIRVAIIKIWKKKKHRNNKCWQGCEPSGTFYIAGGKVKWFSPFGKQFGGSRKQFDNLNIELSNDPEIPLHFRTIDKDLDTWIAIFFAALFKVV